MPVELGGAVALVTGASSGIGEASARALAARGAKVLVAGRDEAATNRVAGEVGGYPLVAELADAEGVAGLSREALTVHHRVDLLVASAGIGAAGAFAQIPPEKIQELAQVNLVAPMLLTRALLPGMLERGRGQVVLIGSIAGSTGVADEVAYSATKAGLGIFAESLRLECYGTGVGVSIVVPGVVRTAFFERRGVAYGRRRPRLVSAERIAAAVVRAIERDRAETIVPRWLSLAPRARGLSPSGYRFLARRFGNN
jgi:short-subunit dehydrogenase